MAAALLRKASDLTRRKAALYGEVSGGRLRAVPGAVDFARTPGALGVPCGLATSALPARLGVPPAACVVFEDALVGVSAGRLAGMRVVGVATTRSNEALLAAGARLVMPDFRRVTRHQVTALAERTLAERTALACESPD